MEVDGSVVYARMVQPFAAFHDEEFRAWLDDNAMNPGPLDVRGSNFDTLVEVMGLCSNPSWGQKLPSSKGF